MCLQALRTQSVLLSQGGWDLLSRSLRTSLLEWRLYRQSSVGPERVFFPPASGPRGGLSPRSETQGRAADESAVSGGPFVRRFTRPGVDREPHGLLGWDFSALQATRQESCWVCPWVRERSLRKRRESKGHPGSELQPECVPSLHSLRVLRNMLGTIGSVLVPFTDRSVSYCLRGT